MVSLPNLVLLARLPFLLGFLLVVAVGVYGLTRPYKTPGLLALAGAALGLVSWLLGSFSLFFPLFGLQRGVRATQIGTIIGTGNCVGSVIDFLAWGLMALALYLAIKGRASANQRI